MKPSHRARLTGAAALVLAAGLTLSGCGGDDAETETGSTATSSSSTTSSSSSSSTTSSSSDTATDTATASGTDAASGDEVTAAQLAEKTGKDGADCWVAVDGTVYDATNNDKWKDGVHTVSKGKATCGVDLTEVLKEAPHGMDEVQELPVVGNLAE